MWAVGHSNDSFDLPPVILHFDGESWADVPQEPVVAWLMAVDAISGTDAWAVGYQPLVTGDEPLTMHWDGGIWRVVPTPDLVQARLNGVSAVSPTDVWAVGYDAGPLAIRPLTLHWDGVRWTRVPAPDAGVDNTQFNAVSAVAADDVWAVGHYEPDLVRVWPLIEHWDGIRWSVSFAPHPPGTVWRILYSVSAASSDDVWAVGGQISLHWDGFRWEWVAMPPPRAEAAVSALSAGDAWSAGWYFRGGNHPVTHHWDGDSWAYVDPPGGDASLLGIDAITAHDVWAVGVSFSQPLSELFAIHSFGCRPGPGRPGSPSPRLWPRDPTPPYACVRDSPRRVCRRRQQGE